MMDTTAFCATYSLKEGYITLHLKNSLDFTKIKSNVIFKNGCL